LGSRDLKAPSRVKITTIGLDVAKSVFQIHGIDWAGIVLQRGQLKRGQVPGFFQKLPPASSALRPVPRHTIGRASCRQSAIMCAGIYKTARRLLAREMKAAQS